MAFFRVVLEPETSPSQGVKRPKNPFDPIKLSFLPSRDGELRIWERLEAKNEEEARRLLEEAKQQGLPCVRGYRIKTIKRCPR